MKRLIFLVFIILTAISIAHGGRTDGQGGHRDNNHRSGLGPYHYHHGYSAHLHKNNNCPFE